MNPRAADNQNEFDVLPPYSEEAEICVIACLMLCDTDAATRMQILAALKPEDFYQADHQILFRILGEMDKAGKSIDAVTLRSELVNRKLLEEIGGVAYLGQILASVPSQAHWKGYADTVRDRSIKRQVLRVALTARNAVHAACRQDNGLQLAEQAMGYRPESPKMATLVGANIGELPAVIPYFIRQNCLRMPRDVPAAEGFSDRFPQPYDLLRGKLIPREGTYLFSGELRFRDSRWGPVWQGDFSQIHHSGSYQIETDCAISAPFMIDRGIYDRLILGYMNFLRAQRCGCAVYGVHPACHLDDGILDADGTPWPVTGGWHATPCADFMPHWLKCLGIF